MYTITHNRYRATARFAERDYPIYRLTVQRQDLLSNAYSTRISKYGRTFYYVNHDLITSTLSNNPDSALETAAAFLTAWHEALVHVSNKLWEQPENLDLFPTYNIELVNFVTQNADDLALLSSQS